MTFNPFKRLCAYVTRCKAETLEDRAAVYRGAADMAFQRGDFDTARGLRVTGYRMTRYAGAYRRASRRMLEA